MLNTEEIAKFEIFNGLSTEEIEAIISLSQQVSYNNNEVILEESSPSTELFILIEGRVRVELEKVHYYNDQKEKVEIVILRKGDIFGEIAFLEGTRRSAYVSAIDKIRAMKIDGKKLHELFNRNNHAGYMFMRNLAVVLANRLIDINFKWRSEAT